MTYVDFLWLMFGIVYLVNFALIGFAVVGLAWAPFGALIYARDGKRKKQNPVRYAVTGAICSILFYIPWLYVRKWIEHKPLPRNNVMWAYAFLCPIWMLGPIPFWWGLSPTYGLATNLVIGGMLAFLAVTLLTLILNPKQNDISNGYLPRWPYLLPLVGLYGCYAPLAYLALQG